MESTDIYKTLRKPSTEVLYKEKKSKFFGYAFPIALESEVKPIIENLRKKHHTANHVCYAWQLGEKEIRYRANDDGEPNNSAGLPIYGQIKSFNVTNILVAVVRIFGGTKLGVGGLITAYRTAAQFTLEGSEIIEKTIYEQITLNFGYPEMDKVMRVVKQNKLNITSQQLEIECKITVSLPQSKSKLIVGIFNVLKNVTIQTHEKD